jgi:hypothetical protein
MVEAGQLRCWIREIPDLRQDSAPGTVFIVVEKYQPDAQDIWGGRWLVLQNNERKWFFSREIDHNSEVVSD